MTLPLIPKGRGLLFAAAVVGSYVLLFAALGFIGFVLTHWPEAVSL